MRKWADRVGVIQVRDAVRQCQLDEGLSPDLISLA